MKAREYIEGGSIGNFERFATCDFLQASPKKKEAG